LYSLYLIVILCALLKETSVTEIPLLGQAYT